MVLAESLTAVAKLEIKLFEGALLVGVIKKFRSNKPRCDEGSTIAT